MSVRWTDLVDPSRDEIEAVLPAGAAPDVLEELTELVSGREPRPLMENHGSFVFGVLVPFVEREEEPVALGVGLIATSDRLVTIRRSSPPGADIDLSSLRAADEAGLPVGELVHRLVDDVVDTYLELLDAIYAQIDALEDRIDELRPAVVRTRLAELRHDLLRRRRTISAARASVRRIVDGRMDAGDPELLPHEIAQLFADTYDTLVRVTEDVDVARDLLNGVRDHLQSKIAESQNEVGKKLTVIASLVLVPSFVVGFFGQNFQGEFDRGYWTVGFSTGVIVVSTLLQLAIFRWRRWV